jgi:hypothetical protein
LAPGVSSVRYPIRQRTFKYVATVQNVTDETCQQLIAEVSVPTARLVVSILRPLGVDLWGVACAGAPALSAGKRSHHPIIGDPYHLLTGRTASGCSRVS